MKRAEPTPGESFIWLGCYSVGFLVVLFCAAMVCLTGIYGLVQAGGL